MRKRTAKRYGTYLAITVAATLFFTGCGKAGGDGQTETEAVSVERRQTLAGGSHCKACGHCPVAASYLSL